MDYFNVAQFTAGLFGRSQPLQTTAKADYDIKIIPQHCF